MMEPRRYRRSGSPTVFVIDDDPAVRQSVCWLVETGGRHVVAFESAQAFLDSYTPDQNGGMSRLLLKFVQQALLVEQATQRWPAVQGRG